MTHVPPDSNAWPRAGADARPSASGEQIGSRGEHGSDLPSAGREPEFEGHPMPPFPEARQHEGWYSAQHAQGHHDEAYRAWRDAHARELDEDYQHFRRERFRSDFEQWRQQRQSAQRDGTDAGEQRSDAHYEAQRPGAFGALSPVMPSPRAGSGDLGGGDSRTGSDPYGA